MKMKITLGVKFVLGVLAAMCVAPLHTKRN